MGDLVWKAKKGVPQWLNLNFLYGDAEKQNLRG
jgi:hypothetical protein